MTKLIAIAGGSGSGKTTIANRLLEYFTSKGFTGDIFSTDHCYKDMSRLSEEQRRELCFDPIKNYDHPDCLNFSEMRGILANLRSGRAFDYERYDFETHSHPGDKIPVEADLDVVFVEGLYALFSGPGVNQDLLRYYTSRLFVSTLENVALARRRMRDVEERGRSPEDVERQIRTTVIPMYQRHVLASRSNAHRFINWTTSDEQEQKKIIENLGDILIGINSKSSN
ncbi:hypothetical protein HOC80_03225 [archaeon]|jgi:uridine kinase|nr:hypothetical protein [archaeon]MBT4417090.1 hypothetical protein [archaeon]